MQSDNRQYGIYIQDDWEATEKLMLNLGVRYDYEETPSYLDFVTPADVIAGLNSVDTSPGALPGQAPHIDVTILARGLLQRLVTRIYFGDEPEANAADPVLAALSAAERATLIAAPAGGGYGIELRLQGDRETVFFRL